MKKNTKLKFIWWSFIHSQSFFGWIQLWRMCVFFFAKISSLMERFGGLKWIIFDGGDDSIWINLINWRNSSAARFLFAQKCPKNGCEYFLLIYWKNEQNEAGRFPGKKTTQFEVIFEEEREGNWNVHFEFQKQFIGEWWILGLDWALKNEQ